MIEQMTVRKVIPGREKFYKCFRFMIRKHNLEYTFCKFKLFKYSHVTGGNTMKLSAEKRITLR